MFTGIIHHTAEVVGVRRTEAGVRLTVRDPFVGSEEEGGAVKVGDSIATNGCCLTVAELGAGVLHFDVIPESLGKTNLGGLGVGDRVHLERSLRAGDRIDGHFVQGHVDGTAEVVAVKTEGEWRVTLRPGEEMGKYIVPKGSVALDGVSLTVARVDSDGFDVTLIPTTLALTRLGGWRVGDRVNLECDATVKTIVATLERMGKSF